MSLGGGESEVVVGGELPPHTSEGFILNTGNVAQVFADIKKKIGEHPGHDFVFNGKMTKRGLLCYDWYKGKGRPRKEDYISLNYGNAFSLIPAPNNN